MFAFLQKQLKSFYIAQVTLPQSIQASTHLPINNHGSFPMPFHKLRHASLGLNAENSKYFFRKHQYHTHITKLWWQQVSRVTIVLIMNRRAVPILISLFRWWRPLLLPSHSVFTSFSYVHLSFSLLYKCVLYVKYWHHTNMMQLNKHHNRRWQ